MVIARLVSLGIGPGLKLRMRVRITAFISENYGIPGLSQNPTEKLWPEQYVIGEFASVYRLDHHTARNLHAIENRSSWQTREGTPPRCRFVLCVSSLWL